jgi:hypothetical protein
MMRWRSWYFIAINTALLWTLAEVSAHVGVLAHRRLSQPYGYGDLSPEVQRAYAHRTPSEVDELWRETLDLRFRYQPLVGFVQAPLESRFFNVDRLGIRSNGGKPNPIDGSTWFFGGSTTFGIAIADDETIPASLQTQTGQPVINFGVRSHASFHENRLLRHYLRLGYRPSRVIFLDGINETCELDVDADQLGDLVRRSQQGYQWEPGYPVVYAVKAFAGRMGNDRDPAAVDELTCRVAGTQFSLAEMSARVLAERNALCGLYGVTCHTFIQPFGGVHGRDTVSGFRDTDTSRFHRSLYEHLEPVWRAANVTFVTGALDDLPEHPYVDSEHYTPAGARAVARAIASHLP